MNSIIQKLPFHFAWMIVCIGIISNMLAAGYMFWAIAVYIPEISNYFSIGRFPVILCFTAGQALSAVFSSPIGRFMDNHGARKSLIIGSIIAGLGFFITDNAFNIYFVLIGWLVVGIARLVTRWFISHRQAALGLVTTGLGLGGVMLPIFTAMTSLYSWQFTLYSGAVLFPLFNIIFALFFLRDYPEEFNLKPVETQDKNDSQIDERLVGMSLFDARQTSTFWILTAAFVFFFMGQGAVNLLGYDFLINEGISNAAFFFGISALIRGLGRLPGSIFVNKISNIYNLAMFVSLIQGLAMLTIVFSTKIATIIW